jgi:hypothetical protein
VYSTRDRFEVTSVCEVNATVWDASSSFSTRCQHGQKLHYLLSWKIMFNVFNAPAAMPWVAMLKAKAVPNIVATQVDASCSRRIARHATNKRDLILAACHIPLQLSSLARVRGSDPGLTWWEHVCTGRGRQGWAGARRNIQNGLLQDVSDLEYYDRDF